LAEVERLRAEVEAENSYLRRDLIANVSHDLRTPLVSMRGYLEVLAAKGGAVGATQRAEYLAIAIRQSAHLARLIDELFELAKLDFKGIAIERESFSLADSRTTCCTSSGSAPRGTRSSCRPTSSRRCRRSMPTSA
jgi:K+-sensing histidine kinase KdpD